ncbi:MAG: ZIP family metal transporter [Myxococcaceae bacterium]|nr:ZIP family metal transporter [Myxococcaceae bacterium]
MSTSLGQLAVYSVLIVAGALAGAAVPLRAPRTRLVTFLAFAAGVMFGAAFFHMLPEAYEGAGPKALSFVPAGFVFLFLIERFVIAHVCEEPPDCAEHTHRRGGMGLAAFFGMSVHTLFDGVALGSSVVEGVGLTAFIAILAHKVPSSLSLAALFKSEGRSAPAVLWFAALFGLLVPAGAVAYLGLAHLVTFERFSPVALAFSAGSFLYIAVSDLLPHVNRHGKDKRLANVICLVGGLAVMLAISFVHHG